MFCASAASRAALRAEIDRQTVQEGDTLTLTIRSDQAQSQERPDVSPLRKDFVVLGTSTSSETSIVNGSRSDSTSWQIQLQPLHTGTIDIPPIAVGNEQTAAIEIDVTKASPQQAKQTSTHVFLEVEAPAAGKSIYVQQQIAYTVRLFYDDTVQSGDLAAPDPENAIVEQLGTGKSLHGDTQRARIQCDRAPLRDCARKKRRPAHSSGKLSRQYAGCIEQPGQRGPDG